MRRTNYTARAVRMDQGKVATLDRAPHVTRWRVWMPESDSEGEEGNPCYGIAIALLLSVPIWLVIGLVTLAFAI